jgi:hypothetical protein
MQTRNLEFVIDQAKDERQESGGIAIAVRDSIEVGVVVPSILRNELKAAGFEILEGDDEAAKFGFAELSHLKRVLVVEDGLVVAMGASADYDDALLHAMLGWFRENPLPGADVPAGIGTV